MKRFFGLLLTIYLLLAIRSYAQTTISQLPYFNGFEGPESITEWTNNGGFDWKLINGASGVYNGQTGQYAILADGYESWSSSDNNVRTAIWTSPIFEFGSTSKNHIFSFQCNLSSQLYSHQEGTFRVQIKINQNDWFTVYMNSGLTSGWEETIINLQPYLTGVGGSIVQMQVRFISYHEDTNPRYNNHMWIDNIHVSGEILPPPPVVPEVMGSMINLYNELGGQVSAIGQYNSSYAPSKAFDNNTSTRWRYDDEDSWIQYEISGCAQYELTEYRIRGDDPNTAPKKFWLYGAIDGGPWIEMDYVSFASWSWNETKTFEVNHDAGYSRFRLETTDTNGGTITQIEELDFYGNLGFDNPTLSPLYANSGSLNYGPGVSEYDNKTSKAWLIKPMDGSEVRLTFDSFDFTCPSDYLRIYDGENRGAPLLGEYRTTYLPEITTSSNHALYVEFLTSGGNGTDIGQGFTASYVSTDFAQSTYPWTQVNDTSFVLDGRLGINTPFVSDEFDLLVNGGLVADELVIESLANAPDYVFEDDYDLKTLEEVKRYIEEYGHLPEVPSAAELEKSGMSISEMNLLLLKKIEELTLHLIESEQRFNHINQRLKTLEQLNKN